PAVSCYLHPLLDRVSSAFNGNARPIVTPKVTRPEVELRPLQVQDNPLLYSALLTADSSWRGRYRNAPASPEAFQRFIWKDVLCQYIVARTRPRAPVGLVSCDRASLRAGVAYLTIVAFPAFRQTGLLLAGVDLFIDMLFADYNLRTLVIETN